MKTDIEPVDKRDVLAKVMRLPIFAWRYKEDQSDARHIGPMAEDFHESFGLGSDKSHISLVAESGLSLAAVQGLHEAVVEKNTELEAQIAKLERANRDLEGRLAALEERIGTDR